MHFGGLLLPFWPPLGSLLVYFGLPWATIFTSFSSICLLLPLRMSLLLFRYKNGRGMQANCASIGRLKGLHRPIAQLESNLKLKSSALPADPKT